MKGLYCKPGGDQSDVKFVIQETVRVPENAWIYIKFPKQICNKAFEIVFFS